MRDWLVKREKREEEGKWPLKLRDRPSVILISAVIEGGSHVGSAKTSKAWADLPPSVAKSMVVLVLLEDSWSAAAHNTSKKLSKRDRARGIMGFIVTVECVCVCEKLWSVKMTMTMISFRRWVFGGVRDDVV